MNKNLTKLVLTALFAAMVCVATMIIKLPTFGTNGYVNIGDTVVLLSAWIIGGVYGGLAAGIGSCLADLISGYGTYVPGTLVIKFFMAIVAYIVYMAFKKINTNKIVAYVVSGMIAEAVMVVGYFLYESTLLGYGIAAAGSIGSNAIQGVTCLVLGLAAVFVLENTKAVNHIKKYV